MWIEPRSSLPGIVSPAFPSKRAAAYLSLLLQLEQSQFASPEALFEQQRRQLQALFQHAARSVPFYRERFREAGVDPRDEITRESLGRIPILTRTQYQDAGKNVWTNALPRSHGKAQRIQTSGSTGRAVTLYKTGLVQRFWGAFVIRDVLWHRPDLRRDLALIRWRDKSAAMAPDGEELENWGTPLEHVFETGPAAMLNIASNLKDQADWLLRKDPTYLLTYPTNLMALIRYFEREGYALSRLRGVFTVSELVTEELRRTCRDIWGAPIFDSYTCEEAGYLALQCPEHEHYHVQSENVYLEIVDEDGRACAPGETGRVLFTSLHNFATPMIRYEVGDYAELGEPCPCGRGLPVLTRILGRSRNRLILPDGTSQFPYLGEYEDYAAITTAVKQFQYVQHSVDHVEKKMVVSEPLSAAQEEQIKALIIRNLGHPFRITLSYHDDIPRSARGKYEEFRSEVAQ